VGQDEPVRNRLLVLAGVVGLLLIVVVGLSRPTADGGRCP
jgi:hypothetical protein